jgi:hypothetical protein
MVEGGWVGWMETEVKGKLNGDALDGGRDRDNRDRVREGLGSRQGQGLGMGSQTGIRQKYIWDRDKDTKSEFMPIKKKKRIRQKYIGDRDKDKDGTERGRATF